MDLPHDHIIGKARDPHCAGGASTGFFPGGEGVYSKAFALPAEWRGKTVMLDVDGAYMNSEVSLNGDLLYSHPYGYTAYQVDLTDRLRGDVENKLSISTKCFQPNSRWYSGGGLYRQVDLLIGGRQYIHPWDLFVTTPKVSAGRATVRVAIEVTNAVGEAADALLRLCAGPEGGEPVARAEARATLSPLARTAVAVEFTIDRPALWDVDDPKLYALRVELLADGEPVDESRVAFGIRAIEIDAKRGFRLNGKGMKLRGGCIHHDNALLGACAFPAAEERKIRILKEAGYNAIRTAHNPPSAALLDACDRLGMLVIDETFDMWRTGKNSLDYHLWFEDWWRRDTQSMVRRDRNHPCVYCWSIGNEVQELLDVSDGAHWAQLQADFVRSLDPTRPVSASANGFTKAEPGKRREPRDILRALAGKPVLGLPADGEDPWGEQTLAASKALDLFGYNYMYGRYAGDAGKFPDRVIHATETHAYHTYDYWQAVLNNDNCIGDFIWTAYDNLGEAGAGRAVYDPGEIRGGLTGGWPWLSCWQGDHDLCGDRRPQSYYRKVMWGLDGGVHLFTTHPSMTGKPFYGMGWHWEDVKRNWTFAEEYLGSPVKAQAYADCDEVEFLVNGKSMGRVKTEELKAERVLPYEPGVLEAVAWRGGAAIARDRIETAGKPARLVLKPERAAIAADGMDIGYVAIELVDEAGVPVVDEPVAVRARVSGAGTLAGLGSANPCTPENYGTGERMTYGGRALVCVRAGRSAGDILVAVEADGISGGEAILRCKAPSQV
ncbi:MAG: glycoside hydrolase family 2 protein [Clostridiales bacterium]|nr:glycoside hydrolase family 2 protein [Clostridiales bacterium]